MFQVRQNLAELFVVGLDESDSFDYSSATQSSNQINPAWEVTQVSIEKNDDGSFELSIEATRNFLPVIYFLIIPLATFCFLSSFVFYIPVESGEKVTFTLTLFLAQIMLHGTDLSKTFWTTGIQSSYGDASSL